MVWFQCEVCGDELKKPKLANHFRRCSASKLSCLDCGKTFGRNDVEGHTQCITESEKYGPKGQGTEKNGSNAKPNKSSAQKPDVDINVGLSERAPWFCSLCNTKATSKQALLLHADGKKHRAKARAFHASQQQPKEPEVTISSISNTNNGPVDNEPKNAENHEISVAENGDSKSSKKRKHVDNELEVSNKKCAATDIVSGLGHGEVVEVRDPKAEAESKKKVKKSKEAAVAENGEGRELFPEEEKGKKDIKWKKLIKSTLKSNPDGALRLKKLKKLILKSLKESGIEEEEDSVMEILEQKIESSTKFEIDGKYVRLVANS